MKRCFLKLSLCLSIISTFLSACGNEELMSKLEDVESYLCEAPDSALAVLDSIPEESLSSGKLRAKYALLRSIALDKNYSRRRSLQKKSLLTRWKSRDSGST